MSQTLDNIIAPIVRARFADAEIESIEIVPDEDSDGDRILRITVVFRSDMTRLEPSKLAGLTRHVRPKLMEQRETGFPIFRFVSKRDNDRLRHEAA